MKYAWIKQYRDQYPVKTMCRVLGVSRSGFYGWLQRPDSRRVIRSRAIREAVLKIYQESGRIYGSYKIAKELQNRESLESACRNTVAKAMREMEIKSCVSRKFKPATTHADPNKKPARNILAQVFEAEAPNQKWAADITYLPTAKGWVYLAIVMDLFSRKIVGWHISDQLTTPLVTAALSKAIRSRRPNTRALLHHSDRGSQYTSDAFQKILKTMNITCSMSRTSCCYDNAVVERFFWSLKYEWTKHRQFNHLEDARLSVFQYIDAFYNSKRIHQTLGYQSPNEFEQKHHAATAA